VFTAMADRDGYIPGVPCWIDTTQPDPEAAVAFYGELFGWELEDLMPPDAPGRYFMARLRGRDVAAVSGAPDGGAAWNTYVWVDSADETAARVREAGGTVLAEPFDVMDAGRMAVFADAEGAAFSVWQAARHRGAAVVNEPGSLNFNGLATRDPERAAAFYGAVFGWKRLVVEGGGEMWQLPGYAEHLEENDPGIRARMREMGAPEGFEDVVATIDRMHTEGLGPPRWFVTFAVADADETAATATRLGGSVLAGPMDMPWVRQAIIADPAGARFIASQFVPPS
jgi:predicted enzyme related to lactoylglutathione lyase